MLFCTRRAKITIRPEWTAVPALNTMMQVVARTSSRIFVGLPLCREFTVRPAQVLTMKQAGILNSCI